MTIPNDSRLRYLRGLAAGTRETYVPVERVEFISILDELIQARDPMDHPLPLPERNQPAVAELAERLTKVEEYLLQLQQNANGRHGETAKRLAEIDQRIDNANTVFGDLAGRFGKIEHAFVQNVVDGQHFKLLNERIDKVVEIIGERISGLADEIAAVRDSAKRAHERFDGGIDWHGEPDPAFPTGGAHTAEAAADAVLPVPQRGDRVRLEGARSLFGTEIENGWWPVLGSGEGNNCFQVGRNGDITGPLYWVRNTDPGLKEVRHVDH